MLCACLGKGEAAARWLEGGAGGAGGALHALELHAARGDWARAARLAALACPGRAPHITLHWAQHLELTSVHLTIRNSPTLSRGFRFTSDSPDAFAVFTI